MSIREQAAIGMRNIKLHIAYDGTNYHGFQRQKNAVSIQQVLEERLAVIFGHSVTITGAGRTDAGVHAYEQVVNFFTTGNIPLEKIPLAAKSVLPPDIVVTNAEVADMDFHARKSARSKIYLYKMYISKVADPFLRNYAWRIGEALDVDAMNNTARVLIGKHDFSAFRASGGSAINPVRTILAAHLVKHGNTVEFSIEGTGFLYHMVRNIIGTLVDVGLGKLTQNDFIRILESRDRRQAGITAPACGLYLAKVRY